MDLTAELAVTEAPPEKEAKASVATTPSPAKHSTAKGEKPPSSSKKKAVAPSSSKRSRSESPNAKSSNNEEEEEKGNEEEEKEEDVEEIEEVEEPSNQGSSTDGEEDTPPAKRAKTPAMRVKTKAVKGKVVKQEQVGGKKTVLIQAKEKVKNRDIVVPKTIDFVLLDRLKIGDKAKEYFGNVGWGLFLAWKTTVYAKLVNEFYNSLKVESEKGKPVQIAFSLCEQRHKFLMADMDINLGMISFKGKYSKEYQAAVQELLNFPKAQWDKIWAELAFTSTFKESVSRKAELKDPAVGCAIGSSPSTSLERRIAAAPSPTLSFTFSEP